MFELTTETGECLRCGRKLKNPKAIKLGYGRCCYRKVMAENKFSQAAKEAQTKDEKREAAL